MTDQEIEIRIKETKRVLLNSFLKPFSLSDKNDLLPFCFSLFQINSKKQFFTYIVEVQHEIELDEFLCWEETKNGKILVRKDPDTGEKMVVINNSRKADRIFEGYATFLNPDQPILISVMSPEQLRRLKEEQPLAANSNWKAEFIG